MLSHEKEKGLKWRIIKEKTSGLCFREATYGISNHPPGSQYIKSAKGTEALRNIVAEPKSKEEMLNALEHMLKDSQCNWPDKQIETQSVVGGTAGPFSHCNQSLSSIFVDMPNKGEIYLQGGIFLLNFFPPLLS